LSTTSSSRTLAEILPGVGSAHVRGNAHVPVGSLVCRSDESSPGAVFFCVPGTKLDGHDFAEDAAHRGAVALVVERWLPLKITQVLVPSVREAMGPVAAEFYGHPAERLTTVGITGTNGKTTTTYLMEAVFREGGLVPGVLGTTGIRIDGRPGPQPRTTPEAVDLHRTLAEMLDEGVQAVAMEVSSHGLHQHRVGGVRFSCAVFTNLSQDHLDYHGTFEEYFRAKAMLFTPEFASTAAVNVDTAEGRSLIRDVPPTLTYGLSDRAELRGEDVELGADGLSFRVGALRVRSRLRGRFNVYNNLAALAAARCVGIDDDAAARGLASVGGVPGRLEPVEEGQEFLVVVDYAHTPDSLENVLMAVRPLTSGRVIVAFGCGGDRDRAKRPMMGAVATRLADLTVITREGCRS
jgi:UDP-N-acetylmuramoyl-L-alanyl-D-glutamate--2,6-diaminopimelate ligase